MSTRSVVLGISAIVFVASAAMTIAAGASMSAMGEMSMPGGWTMSHMWMVMPGQSWFGATASFVGMWTVMMAAMMTPALTPALTRYHVSVAHRTSAARAGWLTGVVGVAYLTVWSAVGLVVFPLGAAASTLAMSSTTVARVIPLVVGAVMSAAGLVQSSPWKRRSLDRCRDASDSHAHVSLTTAWRHGFCLGLHCVRSCACLTAMALCLGIMNPRVMAAVAIAVTVERLAPNGARAARLVGVVAFFVGLSMLVTTGWRALV